MNRDPNYLRGLPVGASLEVDPESTRDLRIVEVEDTTTGQAPERHEFDLVVLSVGVVPHTSGNRQGLNRSAPDPLGDLRRLPTWRPIRS